MTFSPEDIAAFLELRGFKREIAGEHDFTAAVETIAAMHEIRCGLIVSGTYGCGKTRLCNAIAELFGAPFRVRLGLSAELVKFDRDWQDYHALDPFGGNVYLDDLGAESPANSFGIRYETVGDFIMQFHERHASGAMLILNTNFNLAEIDARYGGRFVSRLKELCFPLKLTGTDKRVWRKVER